MLECQQLYALLKNKQILPGRMDFMKNPTNAIVSTRQISKQLQSVYSDPTLCQQYAWWILEAITKKK